MARRPLVASVLIGALLLLSAPRGRADVVILKNGSRFEGKIVFESEEKIVLQTGTGRMNFQKSQVKELRRDAPPPEEPSEPEAPEAPPSEPSTPPATEEASLPDLSKEYRTRRKSAGAADDPREWLRLLEWLEAKRVLHASREIFVQEIGRWIGACREQAASEAVSKVTPEADPAPFAEWAARALDWKVEHSTLGKYRQRYLDALKKSPLDDAFYRGYLSLATGRLREPAHVLRSEALLREARQSGTAEAFAAAARWHESISEEEFERAPDLAACTYVRAMRASAEQACFRAALESLLAGFLAHETEERKETDSPGRPPCARVIPFGLYDKVDLPDPTKEEKDTRDLGIFKVQSGAEITYRNEPPATKGKIDRVWKRVVLDMGMVEDTGGVVIVHEGGLGWSRRWVALQWDAEASAWVLFTRDQERAAIRRLIQEKQDILSASRKTVEERLNKAAVSGGAKPPVERLFEALEKSKPRADDPEDSHLRGVVQNFMNGLRNDRSTVGTHLRQIPRLEAQIREIERELKKRGG